MNLRLDVLLDYAPLFLEGLRNALLLTVVCLAAGIVLGVLLGMGRLADSRYVPARYFLRYGIQWPVRVYVSFFRGTPLFVKILLFHFAVMPLLVHPEHGWWVRGETARHLRAEYGAFLSGALAISMNLGAYLSEVFRAGIQSLDRGQTEAAQAIGMSYWQTMRHVVLPQAFARMLPATGNHAIFTLKDTSLVSAIGFSELAYAARTVSGATARTWEPYLAISIVYWILVVLMSWGVARLEHRLGQAQR
ncbi:MAG: amino acid ABC transporter permease [Rubrivivax sp.]|nr:amino acid ABC transporter permease [Rubrivivax sp.]